MLEMLCRIPDPIGWTLVGILAVANLFMMWQLGKIFYQMWKDRHEPEEEDSLD